MTVERIRLFVAVSIPHSHLERLDSEIEPFRSKVTNARWTALENQHVTLKFLGPTPSDRLEEIEKVCEIVAGTHDPSRVSLSEIGAFPSRTRVRVLWVGLEDPAGLLGRLAVDLARSFEPLGYASEQRAFTPHLTLARFKIPVPLKGGLPEVDLSPLEPFEVADLELFRSHLSPKGARYEKLRSFALRSSR